MPFDPFDLTPVGRYLSQSQYDALVQFWLDEGRAPTESEVEAITGPAIPTPASVGPPPDGFAGRDWSNPNWLRDIIRRQTA